MSDSSVELEGWMRMWEKPDGISPADLSWVKNDTERGLFTHVQVYQDSTGVLKRRRVMKSNRMWFYPPEPPGYISGTVPPPHLFFRGRVFFWRPVGVWRYSLRCPRGEECAGSGKNLHLYVSGYHNRVRQICDITNWYSMLTEVLRCGPCTEEGRKCDGGEVGRWLAWDPPILCQLSEAHQAMFPAVLTHGRGVDKSVIQLLQSCTKMNSMMKVCRQVQENHTEEYLQRKDLYTTLLMTLKKPGGIVSAFKHRFEAPPPQRELPSVRLLRHAYLLAEAGNMQDYRKQILSTFGTVLKLDSTKKVSGQAEGSAEWFTSIGNENSQIVSFVVTCEDSTECLKPMCKGLMDRFQQANQPVPKILYVDRGCCCAQGPTAVETLFQTWVDSGMVVRLDLFHWIHCFDAAVRTDSHSKYTVFKSALAGAVLACNRADLELLIKAVRAQDLTAFDSVADEDMVRLYVSREQLKHHVRRVTLGAQETFQLIQRAIDELKGPAGMDQSGVSLFKSTEAIDGVWEAQQRHLECIQDPPEMSMYRVAGSANINGVDVPYYKCLRGNNSLEGFYKTLPYMIPGSRSTHNLNVVVWSPKQSPIPLLVTVKDSSSPHCAAHPFHVHLISGIARWNSDRSPHAVFGVKKQMHRSYSAPLIERLNTRCRQLFGEHVEENVCVPAAVTSNERLGLEYLFSQSTGEFGDFSLTDLLKDAPRPEEEVIQQGQAEPDEDDEAYQSDPEADQDAVAIAPAHITLTTNETTTAHPPAFEDARSSNPLTGFQQLERFCSLLADMGLSEAKLNLTPYQRNRIIDAWDAVQDHDKQPQRFLQLYRTRWGNTLYCQTKTDDLEADPKHYLDIHNRLMYTLVKRLWLGFPHSDSRTRELEKTSILEAYDRIKHFVLVEDPVLCKVGIPLPQITLKTICDFICHQETLINMQATRIPSSMILKTEPISLEDSPPAPSQPSVFLPHDYPKMEDQDIPIKEVTKVLKKRSDIMVLAPFQPESHMPHQKNVALTTIFRPLNPRILSTNPCTQVTPATDRMPVITSSQSDTHPSWSRATIYRRKHKDTLTQVGAKQSRVHNLPICTLCQKPTQGHKKYKKKSFCPVKMMSTSKGLDNRVFSSYEHFMTIVDLL
ncbi:uncharacterized protein si:ch211-243p7.3 [Danio aesculapii]|uniref:uncharacterized protein si:ch211-243p7.3 n=1 Tax=Danio aesculapii TaxID=1142201 RepID=UPI0024BF6C21|nr:uncharacterized protein si:ch211-243p7.3 [Danio aesculapii]XP_056319083.1 uncharacterized protein si:ch211-243p7.3 [Danio aesculapii]